MMLKYVFFALFVIVSVWHLVDSWLDVPKRRSYTKPFLLITLIFYYVFAADPVIPVLIAALATSWLGDVLLMPKGTKWFVAGGISFLVSHILFIFVYLPQVNLSALKWAVLIPAAAVYYGISVAVTLAVKKNVPKPILVPMILYLIANSTMNLFAIAQLMSVGGVGAWLAYAGAVFFFASDCTLYLVRYHDNRELIFKKHFTVMLTYLLGEALITVGMLLVSGGKF